MTPTRRENLIRRSWFIAGLLIGFCAGVLAVAAGCAP